jgi:chromosome segregation ATPase
MKAKLAIVALLFLSIGLGVAVFMLYNVSEKDRTKSQQFITTLQSERDKLRGDLDEQRKVNYSLENTLSNSVAAAKTLSTNLTTVASNLSNVSSNLVEAKTALAATETKLAKNESNTKSIETDLATTKAALAAAEKAKKEEIAARDTKLASLEGQNDQLGKQIGDLTNNIAKLNIKISDAERRLAVSEGDREFLLKELKRLQADKSELERQLNDLNFLRDQINHLKSELSIAKRLDWIRRGLLGGEEKKGGQILVQGFRRDSTNAAPRLDVEIRRDGTATTVPPK